jgi:peptidyl-prolyl cis-trans isomerase A (cyclophilin A)
MKKIFYVFCFTIIFALHCWSQKIDEKKIFENLPKGYYAAIVTDFGTIVFELYEKQAPKTVKNFVDLALGNKEWIEPNTGQKVKKPFYNGLIFHA